MRPSPRRTPWLRRAPLSSAATAWWSADHFQLIYEGGTSDVEEVRSESTSGYVYDLHGRLIRQSPDNLEDMPKGVYIIKGEKVLVK